MGIRLVWATLLLHACGSILTIDRKLLPGSALSLNFTVYSVDPDPVYTVSGSFAAEAGTVVEMLVLDEFELHALLKHSNASAPTGAKLCSDTGVRFPPALAKEPPKYSTYDVAKNLSFALNFTGEGMFTIVFAACDNRSTEVYITGEVTGQDYASGQSHPLRTFNRLMGQIYTCVLVLWLGMLVYYRATAIAIQKWVITGVLLCCCCEHLCAFADWRYYEEEGGHHLVFVAGSLLLNAWKNSLSRMLLIVLCLGFGVIKSEVESSMVKVLVLGFGYFLSYLAYNVILYFFHTEATSSRMLFAAIVPIVCLDVVFYYWTLTSIKEVKRVLKELKWEFKLQVYERMTSILILSVILSVAWLCIELLFRTGHQWPDYWRVAWMFDSLWQFVFAVISMSLVWLWRPDSRSNLLAFTEQPSFDEDRGLEEEKERPQDENKFAKETYMRRGPHSFSIED